MRGPHLQAKTNIADHQAILASNAGVKASSENITRISDDGSEVAVDAPPKRKRGRPRKIQEPIEVKDDSDPEPEPEREPEPVPEPPVKRPRGRPSNASKLAEKLAREQRERELQEREAAIPATPHRRARKSEPVKTETEAPIAVRESDQ